MKRTTFKIIILTFIYIGAIYACTSNGADSTKKAELNIAVAANMQFAMDSLVQIFEKDHGINCEVSANSSGMLTAQIEKGAPFDLFVSANLRYPNILKEKGYADAPVVYAQGSLILVYRKGKYRDIDDVWKSKSVTRIGIAQDKTAPYGMAARDYLKKRGIEYKISKKLVIGESVGQVNQYIQTGVVDAAFTSYSYMAKFPNAKFLEVDDQSYDPIHQGAVILKHGKENHMESSKAFMDFLLSEKAGRILEHFGYKVN